MKWQPQSISVELNLEATYSEKNKGQGLDILAILLWPEKDS